MAEIDDNNDDKDVLTYDDDLTTANVKDGVMHVRVAPYRHMATINDEFRGNHRSGDRGFHSSLAFDLCQLGNPLTPLPFFGCLGTSCH